MNNDENAGREANARTRHRLARELHRSDVRAGLYTAAAFVVFAAAIVFGVSDNRRAVTTDGAIDYPIVYAAVSGSDAALSPSDVETRAENYLDQFREFDRTYCYEYWAQCQKLLAETPGYAPQAELTEQARADYERYVLVARTAAEESRAFSEKLKVCLLLAAAGAAAIAAMGINRALAAVSRTRLERLTPAPEPDGDDSGGNDGNSDTEVSG